MCSHVRFQLGPWCHWLFQKQGIGPSSSWDAVALGHCLFVVCSAYWFHRRWRNIDSPITSPDFGSSLCMPVFLFVSSAYRQYTTLRMILIIQLRVLLDCTWESCVTERYVRLLILQVPLMLSPDAGNMGVQAAYIFAGLVLVVLILCYFFYPEVGRWARSEADI